jgi:hypothetical protein
MANPRAFLSFDFDHDSTDKILFVGQADSESPTPFTLEDWSSKASLPEAEWEKQIAKKVGNCHLMIVLVGKHMSGLTASLPKSRWQRTKTCRPSAYT